MAVRINCTCQRENRRPFSVTVSKYMPNISKYHESIYLSIDLSIYLSNIQPKYGVSMHVWFFHSPECRVIGVCCIRQAHLNITCRLISWSRDDSHGRLAFWVSVLLCTPFSINITIHLPKLFRSISTCCT
jgi:hypothetical protein